MEFVGALSTLNMNLNFLIAILVVLAVILTAVIVMAMYRWSAKNIMLENNYWVNNMRFPGDEETQTHWKKSTTILEKTLSTMRWTFSLYLVCNTKYSSIHLDSVTQNALQDEGGGEGDQAGYDLSVLRYQLHP